MKFTGPVYLLIFLNAFFFFSACSQEEEFASNPMAALHFSADTLSFDTVFSTLGTTTAWLKIYNSANRKIRISDIRLKSGGTSGYRINLDGQSAGSFANVDIPAKDSLFLFVALTPSEQNSSKPIQVSDAVVFQSDTGQKQIVLEAYSQDAVIWHGKTITSDTTLTADKPFIIYDSLVVAANATLHIAEGTTLCFHDGAGVIAYGNIKASGSFEAPVTFRGDRLDDVLKDFPYDNYPGQWGYIYLAGSSYENEFDHVRIRGGNYGLVADSSSLDRTKLTLKNSVIHNMSVNCMLGYHCKIVVSNSQITNSGGSTIYLVGGISDFVHCTIANYQRLVTREGPALDLVNYFVNNPLKASFVNCIVYGSLSAEIGMSSLKNAQISWDLLFKRCLLRSDQAFLSKFSTITDCLFSKDPQFLKLGSEAEKYQYDFRIDSLSAARDSADLTYSILYPLDLSGISRLQDQKPDIGAYEWNKINK